MYFTLLISESLSAKTCISLSVSLLMSFAAFSSVMPFPSITGIE